MEDRQKYLDDLAEIRDIMNRSSRFISLSGYSGIAAGIIALVGSWVAYMKIYDLQGDTAYQLISLSSAEVYDLLFLGLVILILALAAGIFFTTRKTRRAKQKIWNVQTRRLLVNLGIPLVTGGILCLVLLFRGFVTLIAPMSLIFYGLALVNASKYTLHEIRGLGLLELLTGLAALFFIGYGLFFWAFGFGILHIVYGILMKVRYG